MEYFKANPAGSADGGLQEQYSVQDDNSDTSSVAGTDSTAGTGSRLRTGMGPHRQHRRTVGVSFPEQCAIALRLELSLFGVAR